MKLIYYQIFFTFLEIHVVTVGFGRGSSMEHEILFITDKKSLSNTFSGTTKQKQPVKNVIMSTFLKIQYITLTLDLSFTYKIQKQRS